MIFFDTEIYHNYFLALFKFEGGNGESHIFEANDKNKLQAFIAANQHETFVSFNGIGFDVPIINAFLAGKSVDIVKFIADRIIEKEMRPWQIAREFNLPENAPFDHIDIMDVIKGQAGLKMYGARINAPKIQDLPIEPDAVIKKEDIQTLRDYCLNDVETTELLYNYHKGQIDLRREMSKQYGIDLRSKSDAQIAETVLITEFEREHGFRPQRQNINPKKYSFRYQVPDFIQYRTKTMIDFLALVSRCDFKLSDGSKVIIPDEIAKTVIKIGQSSYNVSIGGLHSMESEQSVFGTPTQKIIDADVTSYYPRIILNLRLFPESFGVDFLGTYLSIVNRRIEAKKRGDKVVDSTLKIVINGSFGKFGSAYSPLFSPDLMIQTTITGQLSLLMLIERLELAGISVVSANTDGIVSNVPLLLENEYLAIITEWEIETGFDMELTHYKSLHSQSVNNYFAVKPDGKVKGKTDYAGPAIDKNPQAPICANAVMDFVAKGKPIEETISECQDITQFIIVRAVTGGAQKDGVFLGKTVRWYYSRNTKTPIYYRKNGNKVPLSEGAQPLQQLPDTLPTDIDYSRYISKAKKMLALTGYGVNNPEQGALL